MSAVKKILKAGVGTAAAVMGAGALVYEYALNTRVNSFFINLFDDRSDVKNEAQSGGCADPGEPGWFDRHKGDDQVITTEATGRIHAYIIPAEKPSHKWAILCHGYNAGPSSVGVFARHYRPLGYNCICPSLRGWGNDEKIYCTMGFHDKDILLAWIDYVVKEDCDAEILLHGYSMGSVTIMLATGEELPRG